MAQQQSQVRVTKEEVLQRIREELRVPEDQYSTIEQSMAHLRESVREFRSNPIGGRLLPIKRMVFWFVASAFDRQTKVIEEMIDLLEESGREKQRLQEQLRELTRKLK
jgi:cell shape-determining protein MreC